MTKTMAEQYLDLADARLDDWQAGHAAMVAFREANKATKRPTGFDKNRTYFVDGSWACGATDSHGTWR